MQTLLIATASEALARALRDALPQYRVEVCRTGAQALALLDSLRPEKLVIGLCLPDASGLDVLRMTRYKPPYILALTELATDPVVLQAAQLGVVDMVRLPCSVRMVADRLAQMQ